MATRKCRNIYFPKSFLAVRKFKNIDHIPKYFCSSVNTNGRFTYSSTLLLVYFICHGPTERGILTYRY